ncbi:MAG TPA: nucleotidyltransferase domain-containing protein [Longimicrobium sp.]|nr:nucleotidyltransferase domain-containing protein [Longimicrobium sp.]
MRKLVTHFLLHPDRDLHVRALRAHTGLGMGALQRELSRLEGLGLLAREERRGRVHYRAVSEHPSWNAFRILLREHGDPAEVLREALRDVDGIRAAFVFGSTVSGNARPGSDIDLFIVEEGMPLAAIGRAAAEVQSLLGRTLDVKRYTPASLARRIGEGSAFLRDALTGPKSWIIGSDNTLLSVA